MAIVIVLALVFVVTLIVTAIVCKVCRKQKLSETRSENSDEEAGSAVHQQLLKPHHHHNQQPHVMVSVNKLDDILYEKPPMEHSTPLQLGPGYCVPDNQTVDNISSVPGIYQHRQISYFTRDKSEKSLGR